MASNTNEIRPIPPEITDDDSASNLYGSSQPNVNVVIAHYGVLSGRHILGQTTSDSNGYWRVELNSPPSKGEVLTAAGNFDGGPASDGYTRDYHEAYPERPVIINVYQKTVIVEASEPGDLLMGWRTSNGAKIIQYQLTGSEQSVSIPFLDSQTLNPGEKIVLTEMNPTKRNMSLYSEGTYSG